MLQLRTFGGVALLHDGQPLGGSAAQRRRLALLAIVAAAGQRGVSRDRVATLLWPESDQERARHSLSQWLFTTRRDLKVEDLFAAASDLRLNPDRIGSDIADFERALGEGRLEAAVAEYRGPFLDGFHLGGSAEFERWVDGERSRLEHRFQDALERLGEERTRAGDVRGALDAWRRLAAADPYSGRISLGLMRALVAVGDAAGAVTHARVHATLVREELGAQPQPDVMALAEQLRIAPQAAQVIPPASPAAPRPEVAPSAGGIAAREATPAQAAAPAPSLHGASADAATDGIAATAGTATMPEGAATSDSHAMPAVATPYPAAKPSPRRARGVGRIRRRRRAVRTLAVALPALLFVAGTAAWFSVPRPRRTALVEWLSRAPIAPQPRRIIVLPLENATGDTSYATFGYMAADWITRELTRLAQLDVVDTRTQIGASRVVAAIPRILRSGDAIATATETAAEYVIEGRYYKVGDSLRVEVRLVDAPAGRVLRTPDHQLGGAASDVGQQALVVTLANRVVGMVAAVADTSTIGAAVGRTLPPSVGAYAEAKAAWERYYDDDVEGFYRHSRRAWALDTSYMTPIAMQAHLHAESREWAQVDTLTQLLEAHQRQLSEMERAATNLFAAALRGELEEQLRGAIAVAQLAPASPETRTYAARVAVNAGQPRRALAILAEVDPSRGVMLGAPWYWNWTAAAQHLIGNYRLELAAAKEGRRRFPNHETAIASYGRALAVDGDGRRILALLDDLPSATSAKAGRRWKIALDFARELQAHGHPAEARRVLERLRGDLGRRAAAGDTAVDRFRATVLADLGQPAEALPIHQRVLARNPDAMEARGSIALTAARLGDRATAQRIASEIAARPEPYSLGRDLMWRARIAAATGEEERAIGLVERAMSAGYPRFFDPGGGPYDEPEIHADPALQSLRRYPRFVRLLTTSR